MEEVKAVKFYLVFDHDEEDGEVYVVDTYRAYEDAIECIADNGSGFIRTVEI
jgi:hypothetical protein